MLRAISAGLSDVGLQREHNEDSLLVLENCDLYVVADGMGGHQAGDVASKMAVETMSHFFSLSNQDESTWPFHFDAYLSEEENKLLSGIRFANRRIYEKASHSRDFHGMGTTVVATLLSPYKGRVYIGHVGDSRCYRIRGTNITQLTRDHSLVNDYILAMPELTSEQRQELPKNVITRALGMQDQVIVDLCYDDPEAGDSYLLCSDGLSGMITDAEILQLVSQHSDPNTCCTALIDAANRRGGEDNITVILMRVEEMESLATMAKKKVDADGPLPSNEDKITENRPTFSEPLAGKIDLKSSSS